MQKAAEIAEAALAATLLKVRIGMSELEVANRLLQAVLEAIERVNRELGTATAVITHNASIGAMADRVVHLSDGQISAIDEDAERAAPESLSW